MSDDDQIRISETVDRSDPLTVDVVLEVHETIASVQEVDGFVRVRFRVPVAEWDAVLGRRTWCCARGPYASPKPNRTSDPG